ncbi:MAG: hypothetical protein ACLSVD_11495 [Eggerthellaceae bacterium]
MPCDARRADELAAASCVSNVHYAADGHAVVRVVADEARWPARGRSIHAGRCVPVRVPRRGGSAVRRTAERADAAKRRCTDLASFCSAAAKLRRAPAGRIVCTEQATGLFSTCEARSAAKRAISSTRRFSLTPFNW